MTASAVCTTSTITVLRELVAAIDRRVPRADSASERHIARDATALKHEALARIAELEP